MHQSYKATHRSPGTQPISAQLRRTARRAGAQQRARQLGLPSRKKQNNPVQTKTKAHNFRPKPKKQREKQSWWLLLRRLTLQGLGLGLLLLDLEEQRAVDVWQDTTEGDGRADQGVELLVTTNGELKVARRDTLDLEVLGGVLETVLARR